MNFEQIEFDDSLESSDIALFKEYNDYGQLMSFTRVYPDGRICELRVINGGLDG